MIPIAGFFFLCRDRTNSMLPYKTFAQFSVSPLSDLRPKTVQPSTFTSFSLLNPGSLGMEGQARFGMLQW